MTRPNSTMEFFPASEFAMLALMARTQGVSIQTRNVINFTWPCQKIQITNYKLQMSMSIAVLACYLFHSVQGAVLPATNYNYTRVSIGDRLARDFQVTIVA